MSKNRIPFYKTIVVAYVLGIAVEIACLVFLIRMWIECI